MQKLPLFGQIMQDFLGHTIVDAQYIFLDYWSIIHFISGSILGFLFGRYFFTKYTWLVVLALLILYEVAEIFLTGILFVAETRVDRLWDVIVGMVAFFLFYYIVCRCRLPKPEATSESNKSSV